MRSLPDDAILSAYDLTLASWDTGTTFIGRFQSAVEKEFLTFVLRRAASAALTPSLAFLAVRSGRGIPCASFSPF